MYYRNGGSQKWNNTKVYPSPKNGRITPEIKREIMDAPKSRNKNVVLNGAARTYKGVINHFKKWGFEDLNTELRHGVAVTSAALISQNTVWAGLEQILQLSPEHFESSRLVNTVGTIIFTYAFSKERDAQHKGRDIDRSHKRGYRLLIDSVALSTAHGLLGFGVYYGVGLRDWQLAGMVALSAAAGLVYGPVLGELMDIGKYIMNVIDEQYAPKWAVKIIDKPSITKQVAFVATAAAITTGSFVLADYQKSNAQEDSKLQPKELYEKRNGDVLPEKTISWFDAKNYIR